MLLGGKSLNIIELLQIKFTFLILLTIILFAAAQGKQYLQCQYEQYTIWTTYSTNSIYLISYPI